MSKRTQETYETAQKLRAEGLGYKRIAKALGLTRDQARELVRAPACPKFLIPKPPDMPGVKLIKDYLKEIGSTSPYTLALCLKIGKRIDKHCIAQNKTLVELVREDVVNIINSSPSKTVKVCFAIKLKTILSWAYRAGYMPSNLVENILIPKSPRKRPIKILTMNEIMLLLKTATEPVDKLFIQALLYTGLRLHEVAAIKIANIDFNSHQILIEKSKGDKKFIKIIPPVLTDRIREYLHTQALPGTYLFSDKKGNAYKSETLAYRLRLIAKNAMPERRIYSHLFRHTYASLAAKSIDSTVIGRQALSESMGWTGDGMFNTYIHAGEEKAELREMVRKMEKTWAVLKEVA